MTQREFIKKNRLQVLRLKLDLERTMRRDLAEYWTRQKKRVRRGEQTESIMPVLDKHYHRIARRLLHRNVKQIDQVVSDQIEDFKNLRANYIDKTTEKNIDQAMGLAREQLAEDGNVNPTEHELLAVAALIFWRLARSRTSNIAMSETQTVTEGLRRSIVQETHREVGEVIQKPGAKKKLEEMYEESQDYTTYKAWQAAEDDQGEAAIIGILLVASKMWNTMRDERVRAGRFNHRNAQGQRRLINEPFVVSGQLLMYPGDTSLGASTGNVAGCRCSATYL